MEFNERDYIGFPDSGARAEGRRSYPRSVQRASERLATPRGSAHVVLILVSVPILYTSFFYLFFGQHPRQLLDTSGSFLFRETPSELALIREEERRGTSETSPQRLVLQPEERLGGDLRSPAVSLTFLSAGVALRHRDAVRTARGTWPFEPRYPNISTVWRCPSTLLAGSSCASISWFRRAAKQGRGLNGAGGGGGGGLVGDTVEQHGSPARSPARCRCPLANPDDGHARMPRKKA